MSEPGSRRVLNVGLTGRVASGKSTVARLWAAEGVPVFDADAASRAVVAPGSPGLAEVRRVFGASVLAPDGTLDRARMRALVFEDEAARRRLEAILHPLIAAEREAWLGAREREGVPLVVSEVPLLFEAGLEGTFDRVVYVDAPEELRLRRLVEDRGLDEGEARRILAAQGDPARDRARADHVLSNAGSHEALELQARALLRELQAAAGGRPDPAESTEGGRPIDAEGRADPGVGMGPRGRGASGGRDRPSGTSSSRRRE